jgi:hypothetical protein
MPSQPCRDSFMSFSYEEIVAISLRIFEEFPGAFVIKKLQKAPSPKNLKTQIA